MRFAGNEHWRVMKQAGKMMQSAGWEAAHSKITKVADGCGRGVNLRPGDIMFVTNETAIHGRYPLEEQQVPPSEDRRRLRWMKIGYMMRRQDEALFQRHSYKGRRFIIQKRGFFNSENMIDLAQRQYRNSLESASSLSVLVSKVMPRNVLLGLPGALAKATFVFGSTFANRV